MRRMNKEKWQHSLTYFTRLLSGILIKFKHGQRTRTHETIMAKYLNNIYFRHIFIRICISQLSICSACFCCLLYRYGRWWLFWINFSISCHVGLILEHCYSTIYPSIYLILLLAIIDISSRHRYAANGSFMNIFMRFIIIAVLHTQAHTLEQAAKIALRIELCFGWLFVDF